MPKYCFYHQFKLQHTLGMSQSINDSFFINYTSVTFTLTSSLLCVYYTSQLTALWGKKQAIKHISTVTKLKTDNCVKYKPKIALGYVSHGLLASLFINMP